MSPTPNGIFPGENEKYEFQGNVGNWKSLGKRFKYTHLGAKEKQSLQFKIEGRPNFGKEKYQLNISCNGEAFVFFNIVP